MNYIQTQYMTNNGKTCKVTGICCNAPKQTTSAGIVTGKMQANAFEVFWTNAWGQPTGNNVRNASISEMASEDENNTATYFDAVLTFRSDINGNVPKTVSCTLENVPAAEQTGSSPTSIAATIQAEWARLGSVAFDGNNVYLANAILTFHD